MTTSPSHFDVSPTAGESTKIDDSSVLALMLSTTAPRELADAIGVRIESISIRYNSSDEFTATVDHAPTAGLLKFVGHYASGTADPVEISVCDGRLRASAADLTITGTPGHRAQIALSMTGYHRFVTAA